MIDNNLEVLEAGVIDPDYLSKQLPLNIIEAKAVDLSRGYFNNAKVALTLAKQTPGGKVNNCTGSGPARISPDGKAIYVHLAFPLQWANLYQTWNMAFVTNFKRWPYTLVKLLIPPVSDYQSNPSSFLYNRILGLYAHLNWEWMGIIYGRQTSSRDMNWHSPSLSRSWGRTNYESAKEYESLQETCK